MKLIGHCLLKITKNLIVLIVMVMIFHEFILLKYFQVDNYLMSSNNARRNFIDANREGIFSLGGYVCLYLIGVFIGRIIIQGESKQKFKEMGLQLFLAVAFLCLISSNSSRKLCNLSYVSSTAGLACMCLGCFSITQWLLLRRGYSTESVLLKNMNQKGLDAFLIGNVLTGIINLNINTIDTSDTIALLIILIYIFLVHIFVHR